MKILLYNIGYCTEFNGSLWRYLRYAHRFFYNPIGVQKRVLQALSNLLHKEDIDLACLLELEQGGINHIAHLDKEYRGYSDIENKYCPNGNLRKLPLFKSKSNGFLSKYKLQFKKSFLKNGTKKLLYEVQLSDKIDLYFFHFSLSARTRQKQFQELSSILKNKSHVILCGDFNIFRGEKELKSLIEETGLRLIESPPTFPSFRPDKTLKRFLVSPDIEITQLRVLKNVTVSDHLPVILELA